MSDQDQRNSKLAFSKARLSDLLASLWSARDDDPMAAAIALHEAKEALEELATEWQGTEVST